MMYSSQQFILLHAVFHNILYIHKPYNSTEAFVCFDNNQEIKNDSQWTQMTHSRINNNKFPTYSSFISNTTRNFKIKIKFKDDITQEFGWISLFPQSASTPTTSTLRNEYPIQQDVSVEVLLYYLALCSSILLLKCIIRIVQRRKCLFMLN